MFKRKLLLIVVLIKIKFYIVALIYSFNYIPFNTIKFIIVKLVIFIIYKFENYINILNVFIY